VLDAGDLRHHTAAWAEDVEELRVAELVLAVDVVKVAAEPGGPGEAVGRVGRAVVESDPDPRVSTVATPSARLPSALGFR
jgi:hypothetical protein